MAIKMAVFAYDNCLGTSITGPIDFFKFANTHGELVHGESDNTQFDWMILSIDGRPVKTSAGLIISVDGDLDTAKDADVALIASIDHAHGRQVLELVKQMSPRVTPWLRELHQSNVILAAQCSGTFFLAESGLLNGYSATTSWWLTPMLKKCYPDIDVKSEALLQQANKLYTCGAFGSYMNLCIHLIEQFAGKEIATRCAKTALMHTQLTSQAPLVPLFYAAKQQDEVIYNAINWMKENLQSDISIEDISARFALSPRTFNRRFKEATGKPPNNYLQNLRIEAARHLLETTDLTLEAILPKIGYYDLSSFRRLFKRELQLSPIDYRRQFSLIA